MPKISSKRQITIPIDRCQQASSLVMKSKRFGHITIVKKERGAAKGILGRIKADRKISDEKSLQSTLEE